MEKFKFQRGPIEVFRSFAEMEEADREYWWSKTDDERLEYMQYLRELNYGDEATARLQRVLSVARAEQR
jgi:hypothetical protein